MKRRTFISTIGAAGVGGLALPAETLITRKASRAAQLPHKKYRCLFNHELGILLWQEKGITAANVAKYIDKLAGTDVDAVMCCPTAWRTNLFPSEVDPAWKRYLEIPYLKKFGPLTSSMKYIFDGGDPVGETLANCRRQGKGFFISYRMNDFHFVDNKEWPTHNAFWRNHPECWLADTNVHATGNNDDVRLLNWAMPAVREHYFSILNELATRYDIDGIEFDFRRCWTLFRRTEVEAGVPLLTEFVKRIRTRLDELSLKRGKYLQLCVRSLETVARGRSFGIDIADWDAKGLIDMVNVSPSYIQTTEINLEDFQKKTPNSRIYGELNFVLRVDGGKYRFTHIEHYRAGALNFLSRQADGISIFNYDWVSGNMLRHLAPGLMGIATVPKLQQLSKTYGLYPNYFHVSMPAYDDAKLVLITGEDTKANHFAAAKLRVETQNPCTNWKMGTWLNRVELKECEHSEIELFPPIPDANSRLPKREHVRFFAVPPELIRYGKNEVQMKNLEPEKGRLTYVTLELALYRPKI